MILSRLKTWSSLMLSLKALQYILSNLPMTIRFTSARGGGGGENGTHPFPVNLVLAYTNRNKKDFNV